MNVIYTLDDAHIRLVPEATSYFEVWRGLPDLAFEMTTERARSKSPALIYERGTNYIWVPPDARKGFIIHGENTIFSAERQIQAEWYVPWLTAFEDVRKAGKVAVESNADLLAEIARSDEDRKKELELKRLGEDAHKKYSVVKPAYFTAKRDYENVERKIRDLSEANRGKHLAEQESRFEEMLKKLEK